jgi:hypothetical protein
VFFALTPAATAQTYAQIGGLQMLYKPSPEKLHSALPQFLQQQGLQITDIDLVLTGENADSNHAHYYQVLNNYAHCPQLPFKHLSGDYETAGAFALWLAAQILKQQQVPLQWFPMLQQQPARLRNILIYNHFFGEQHTFMLLHAV